MKKAIIISIMTCFFVCIVFIGCGGEKEETSYEVKEDKTVVPEEIEQEETKDTGTDENIVGKWIDNLVGGVYIITKKNGSYLLDISFNDGSKMAQELVEKTVGGQKRLSVKNNDLGEYYIVHKDGKLGVYDKDGLISKLPAVK